MATQRIRDAQPKASWSPPSAWVVTSQLTHAMGGFMMLGCWGAGCGLGEWRICVLVFQLRRFLCKAVALFDVSDGPRHWMSAVTLIFAVL